MDLKSKISKELRSVYGEFETYLEYAYEDKFINSMYEGDLDKHLTPSKLEEKKRWVTYNQVIIELKHNLKDMLKVKELQYRLTDAENPNDVCIEIIKNLDEITPELERLYLKIINF
jgi:hypothetical protein